MTENRGVSGAAIHVLQDLLEEGALVDEVLPVDGLVLDVLEVVGFPYALEADAPARDVLRALVVAFGTSADEAIFDAEVGFAVRAAAAEPGQHVVTVRYCMEGADG